MKKDYRQIAEKYEADVLSGAVPAGQWVKKAARRNQQDMEKWAVFDPYIFSEEEGCRVCQFAEMLHHTKGALANTTIVLEPWQVWLLYSIFGWRRRSDGGRRFRRVYIEVPRGNGKSCLSSVIALYCLLCDREPGAEVYSFATTRDQAKIVFNDAKRMCEINAPLRKAFGIEVLANAIVVRGTNSTFQAKSAEGSTLDGLNTHFACIDELHAHKTRAVYDVVETSMGKRDNSLLWIITTAGFNLASIGYEVHTLMTKILDGVFVDDEQFAVMYTIDPEDIWWTEEAARKANPNWGVSVKPNIVMGMLRKAKELPSAANNIKTKHLNIWCNAGVAWIDMQKWDACGDETLDISMFEHQPCYIGLDLASKCDVTAKVLIFPQTTATGERKLYMFPTFYLPEAAVERSTNSQYAGWVEQGWITQTEGGVTDFARVEDDLREDMERFDVKAIGYDPWNAAQLAADLDQEFAPMVEIRQYGQKASDDAKWFEAFILSGQIVHNTNPCMTWMVSNAVAKGGEMLKIVKDTPDNKIDGVDAATMAVGLCAIEEGNEEAFNDFMNNIIVV